MRYEDNLHFIVEVDSRYLDYVLPPLSIQILVENAVKHNEISSRKPLVIEIGTIGSSTDGTFSLFVENALQPRRTVSSGTGIGLVNLAKRYELLLGKEIRITEANGRFRVCIPLVKT